MRSGRTIKSRAFTLVELLVVIGIIAVLIGILIPVLSKARRHANDLKCKSNIRQVCTALMTYAAEWNGKFPPNIELPYRWFNWWCDSDRIGRYLRGSTSTNADQPIGGSHGTLVGPVLVCPEDEGARRSYAMNFWASSAIAYGTGLVAPPYHPRGGKGWGPNSKESAKLFLVGEALSFNSYAEGEFVSYPVLPRGMRLPENPQTNTGFSPGKFFIGKGTTWGEDNPLHGNRYYPTDTEFDYARHRRRSDGATFYSEARGRANFGFADGHVATFTPDELAHRTTRKSKFVVLWSPLDYQVERLPRP